MNYAIVGYGKMGRAIESVAAARGHRLTAVVDPSAPGFDAIRLDRQGLGGAALAFEFTTPKAAPADVRALLRAGVRVVCGTTGWTVPRASLSRIAAARRTGAVLAPNFSVGMNLFYRVVEQAARLYGATGLYDAYVREIHHRAKADAPGGTAKLLAARLLEASGRGGRIVSGLPEGPLAPADVHLSAVRAGHEPGTHEVGFDGEHDVVSFEHRARGRAGFALGAVLAAEWLERRRGIHDFKAVLDTLLAGGVGGRR